MNTEDRKDRVKWRDTMLKAVSSIVLLPTLQWLHPSFSSGKRMGHDDQVDWASGIYIYTRRFV